VFPDPVPERPARLADVVGIVVSVENVDAGLVERLPNVRVELPSHLDVEQPGRETPTGPRRGQRLETALGRLLSGKITRLGALEELVYEGPRLSDAIDRTSTLRSAQ